MSKINNIENNDNINNKDNSLYDNLNIYEKQNDINIEIIYNTSYIIYKKKIFSLAIKNNFDLITNLFDENICDILINIYILKKKNKISDKQFIIFKIIFEFAEKLNNINFIDQENFILILVDLYKLNNICIFIENFFDKYLFKELIDYKIFIDKINYIFLEIKKDNFLFTIFDEIYENYKLNNYDISNTNIKNLILKLAKKLSFDLFMFYDSEDVFNILISSFNIFDLLNFELNPTDINNLHSELINKNKNILNILKSNKKTFLKEYSINSNKYFDIYSNDIELYIKFKINKNLLVEELIKNIIYIDKLK